MRFVLQFPQGVCQLSNHEVSGVTAAQTGEEEEEEDGLEAVLVCAGAESDDQVLHQLDEIIHSDGPG